MPDNFTRIQTFLKKHTSLSYFLSPTPYLRPIRKLFSITEEYLATLDLFDGKSLLDQLIREAKRQAGLLPRGKPIQYKDASSLKNV